MKRNCVLALLIYKFVEFAAFVSNFSRIHFVMGAKINLIEEIKALWDTCESKHSDVFRYKVNVTRDKVLKEGNFKFYIQVSKFLGKFSRTFDSIL